MKNKKFYDLVVIGGGPAGMMTASIYSELNSEKKVIILEKNDILGNKLRITGGGRCNITNATFDYKKFLEKFPETKKYLYSPFSQFSIKDTFEFFEKNGLELVTEARNRVFPKSQKAIDVVKTFLKILKKNKVEILTNAEVVDIRRASDGSQKIETALLKDGRKIFGKNFVIATGGLASPKTGSTGDGFKWLKKLGLKIKKPNPNIVPLKTDSKILHQISGTAWNNAGVKFIQDGKAKIKKTGRILFTHFGLSAPLILNTSYEVKQLLKKGEVWVQIDLFPDLDESKLDKKILKIFEKNKNKKLKNVLVEILQKRLSEAIIKFLGNHLGEKAVNEITKEERKKIVKQMKNIRAKIIGTLGMEKAVIADGGLVLDEVDTKTMKVKNWENLYVVGDVLNINRPSGGYSLQLCWTTGYVVAKNLS